MEQQAAALGLWRSFPLPLPAETPKPLSDFGFRISSFPAQPGIGHWLLELGYCFYLVSWDLDI